MQTLLLKNYCFLFYSRGLVKRCIYKHLRMFVQIKGIKESLSNHVNNFYYKEFSRDLVTTYIM